MSYQFRGQRPEEEVVLFSRCHPFILFKPLLASAFVLLIPVAVDAISPVGFILSVSILVSLTVAGIVIWSAFTRWSKTLFLVTTERVVWLQQHGPFSRSFEELSLNSIFQVSHSINGIFPTLFGYGTLQLFTGGSHCAMEVPAISEPYEIQQEIQDAIAGVSG